jgi:hypothetical protein
VPIIKFFIAFPHLSILELRRAVAKCAVIHWKGVLYVTEVANPIDLTIEGSSL